MLEYNILNMEIASVAVSGANLPAGLGPYSVLEFFHYKCKKCNSVMKSKIIHELSKRNERKRMRKINDMMEKLDNDIADVRNVLSRFRPALNHIKRRNQSSQMQNDQLWKPTASPLVKTANPKQLEESLMTL